MLQSVRTVIWFFLKGYVKLNSGERKTEDRIFSRNLQGWLKVLYCNARVIRSKMDDLIAVLGMEDIDIIGITVSRSDEDDFGD